MNTLLKLKKVNLKYQTDKDIDSVLAYIKSYWPKDKYEHQIGISK